MTTIETVINQPIKQSLSYLEKKILAYFPLLSKIKAKKALMTTKQYNAVFPLVAENLYQSITDFDHQIHHYIDLDSADRELKGFFLINVKTWEGHYFLLTYEGSWLYNNQPISIPAVQEINNKYICNAHECTQYNKLLNKENLTMNNIERLQMEIAGIELPHEELLIYLKESNLEGYDEYNASLKSSKKAIYESALSVLHSIANQPQMMKNYKQDDMTISEFAKYLQSRIKQLELKVRQMPTENGNINNFFNLFK